MAGDALHAVVFSIGGQRFALPTTAVREILRKTTTRPVVSDDETVRGVISLRGTTIAVHDLRTTLGIDAPPADDAKILVIESADAIVGIVVDTVEEVITIAGELIDELPLPVGKSLAGVARVDDELLLLLTPDELGSGRLAA